MEEVWPPGDGGGMAEVRASIQRALAQHQARVNRLKRRIQEEEDSAAEEAARARTERAEWQMLLECSFGAPEESPPGTLEATPPQEGASSAPAVSPPEERLREETPPELTRALGGVAQNAGAGQWQQQAQQQQEEEEVTQLPGQEPPQPVQRYGGLVSKSAREAVAAKFMLPPLAATEALASDDDEPDEPEPGELDETRATFERWTGFDSQFSQPKLAEPAPADSPDEALAFETAPSQGHEPGLMRPPVVVMVPETQFARTPGLGVQGSPVLGVHGFGSPVGATQGAETQLQDDVTQDYSIDGQEATQAPPLHGQEATQAPQLHGQEATQAPPLHGQEATQAPPLHGQEATQAPPLHGQEATQAPPLHGQEATQAPPLHGQEATQAPPLHGQEATQAPPLHGQEATQAPLVFGETESERNEMDPTGEEPRGPDLEVTQAPVVARAKRLGDSQFLGSIDPGTQFRAEPSQDSFFLGCCVFIVPGLRLSRKQIEVSMRAVERFGGVASRCLKDSANERTTHVLTGATINPYETALKALDIPGNPEKFPDGVNVMSIGWLDACIAEKRLVHEERFIVRPISITSPPQPKTPVLTGPRNDSPIAKPVLQSRPRNIPTQRGSGWEVRDVSARCTWAERLEYHSKQELMKVTMTSGAQYELQCVSDATYSELVAPGSQFGTSLSKMMRWSQNNMRTRRITSS